MAVSYYRACPAGTIPYTIRKGDTLYKIAGLFSTGVQDILLANPGIYPDYLRIGQQICIPQRPQIYPSCPTTNYYVIRPKDTLESIAAYFGIPYEVLLNANLGMNPGNIYIDQVICIPVAPPTVSVDIDTSAHQLVVNKDNSFLKTYRIATGKPSSPTFKGDFTILIKQVNDPDSPYGSRRLRLSQPDLEIDGTSNTDLIGKSQTNGNILMLNTDIIEFFNLVPVNTPVRIY